MARLAAVKPEAAEGKTKELFGAVQKKLGMVPNLIRTFGNSSAVLQAYLGFSGALEGGVLSAKLREQLALAVGQANQCGYCLSAHTAIGKMVGLSEEEILDNRQASSTDAKTQAALQFATSVVINRGLVSDKDYASLEQAGYTNEEIAEIIGAIALNLFTNYFNHIAETEIDFPAAPAIETSESYACGCAVN